MTDPATVLVPLAPGFEEIEAVTIIDVLRRAEVEVTVGGLGDGPLTGSRGVVLLADAPLDGDGVEMLADLVRGPDGHDGGGQLDLVPSEAGACGRIRRGRLRSEPCDIRDRILRDAGRD